MNRIALFLALLSITPPAFAGNLYCAPAAKHVGYAKSYATPVYAKSNYVEKVVQYPQQAVNVYNVFGEQLIKHGQTHYSYAKIGEYGGLDINLQADRIARAVESAASIQSGGIGALAQITNAERDRHAQLILQQQAAKSDADAIREFAALFREFRAYNAQKTTLQAGGGELPDGALAAQAVGLATCVKCHQKYADPSKLSLDEVKAATAKIVAGEMPLGPDKQTPVPLSGEDAAAVIAELYGAGQ